jgi:hypothetical protein
MIVGGPWNLDFSEGLSGWDNSVGKVGGASAAYVLFFKFIFFGAFRKKDAEIIFLD